MRVADSHCRRLPAVGLHQELGLAVGAVRWPAEIVQRFLDAVVPYTDLHDFARFIRGGHFPPELPAQANGPLDLLHRGPARFVRPPQIVLIADADMLAEYDRYRRQRDQPPHPTPVNIGPYTRLFGVPPRFNAEQHALVFPKDLLARPVLGADPKLRQLLQNSVAEYWALQHPSMTERVVRILRLRVVFGNVSLEDVADQLSMHPRTMNRNLQAEGTSFRSLLNESRFQVARQLMAGTRIGVTDIALTLGYSEPSGFTHAFKRWSGTAPIEWRASL